MITHRTAPAVLAALAVVLASASLRAQPEIPAPPAAPADSADAMPLIASVDAVSVTVSDLERSIDFYTRVLGFRLLDRSERAGRDTELATGVFGCRVLSATLALADERLILNQFLAPEGRPIPPDSRSHDAWFQHIAIVVRDIDAAYAHLRAHNIRHASSGPQTLPDSIPAAAGISAFYFKDPDAHVLEVIHFPPGKGDPRWHRPTTDLFLGIDHTAIVVSDTERALAFYRDTLGLRVVGASENFGTEQEHLNNVFGARLRITALRPNTNSSTNPGPGVELLEYLAPSDARPYPIDSRASDLWHWEIHLTAPDLPRAHDALRAARPHHARVAWVTPGIVDTDRDTLLVRDPDRHAVRVSQPAPRP